jgi:hypothetical protein
MRDELTRRGCNTGENGITGLRLFQALARRWGRGRVYEI